MRDLAVQPHYLITGASSGLGQLVHDVIVSMLVPGHKDARITTLGRAELSGIGQDEMTALICISARELGPYTGILHAAGKELIKPLRMMKESDYRTAMEAAEIAFALLRACAMPGVMADEGSIVLMSSVAASRGSPGLCAYAACKAAIEGMMRCAAIELSPRRIRVNCIAAGAFDSPMHQRITSRMSVASFEGYEAAHALGFGAANDIAAAALFLLSPAAAWITGTTMVVDGGFLA